MLRWREAVELLAEEPVGLVGADEESGCEVRPPKASVESTQGASAVRDDEVALLAPPPPPLAAADRDEDDAEEAAAAAAPLLPLAPPPPLLLLEAGGGAEGLLLFGFPPPSPPSVKSSFSATMRNFTDDVRLQLC